jgi:methylase of polypeptide subunit release factors
MGVASAPDAPVAGDDGSLRQLRTALWNAEFVAERVREALGVEGEALAPGPAQVPLLQRSLRAGPLTTLIELFLLGIEVGEREAEAALPLAIAEASGLVSVEARSVSALVRLTPFRGFLLASDKPAEGSPGLRSDHVMGITPSTLMLLNLTPTRPVGAVLDVGAGSGIQALAAARHAERVVAVDVNPRALAFTTFNAKLNGCGNIDCRHGSLFEPVPGERFDLVLSNPPFVISPDEALAFRDSGLQGDTISREIVLSAAAHLEEGGRAIVLVSWGLAREQPWEEPLRAWVESTGCDALLLHYASHDPLRHAASWNEPLARDALAYGDAIDRWLEYFGTLGIEIVAYGAVVLRRRSGSNWIRCEDLGGASFGPSGDEVDRLLRTQDWLGVLPDDDALLEERLRLVERHRLEQTLRCRDGAFAVADATLTLEQGLPFRAAVDGVSATLLTRLDGTRTLREAVAETVELLGVGAELGKLEGAAGHVARRMLELGFLQRD